MRHFNLSKYMIMAAGLKLGIGLNNLGAPLELWETLSNKSKRHKNNACSSRWFKFKQKKYSMGSLVYLAKEGDIDKYNSVRHVIIRIN